MLTKLQKTKLERFFNILDFDCNGVIEKADFLSLAENLCVLWGIQNDSADHSMIIDQFEASWLSFSLYVDNNQDSLNLQNWLDFADQFIVNGDERVFKGHIINVVGQIFDYFDTNHDGHISIDEFVDLFVAFRIEIKYSAKSFRNMDLNKDDVISKEELISAFMDFFRSDDERAPGNWLFGLS